MSEFDPYALSAGLVDDYDYTITEAYFTTDARYNEGNTVLLKLVGTTDSPDLAEATELLSVGTGWEIVDNGKAIAAENGKPRNFNKSSKVGLFLAAALEAGAGDALRKRGVPTTAATFEGLTFHMKRKTISYGGEIGDKEVILPESFVGEAGSSAAAPAATLTVDTSAVSPVIKAKLTAAAQSAADYAAFIEAGFAIDGVDGNAAAEALLTDASFFDGVKAAA